MAEAFQRAIALITYEIYEARISVEIGGVWQNLVFRDRGKFIIYIGQKCRNSKMQKGIIGKLVVYASPLT
jgi:hypothetical protein